MAQSKSFFGLRKGSTKSLTFQVLNGKQITKDRVYNVKNPQTLAQMQQRALMATVVVAYSKMKTICDHSFEGIEVGSKTMSEFIKANLLELKNTVPSINLTEYKAGQFASNTYIISRGTLPSLSSSTDEIESVNYQAYKIKSSWDNSLTYPKLAENVGLKKDGMLTVVQVFEGQLWWVRLKFTEKIMASSKNVAKDTNLVSDMQSIDPNSVEGNGIDLAGFVKIGTNNGSEMSILVQRESGDSVALIKSIKEGIAWKRSTEYLSIDVTEFNYDAAFSTYPINTSLLLNGGDMPSNILK